MGYLPARPLTQLEAVQQRPKQPLSGIKIMGQPGCSVGLFLSDYRKWLQGMIEEHKPSGVIVEEFVVPHNKNGLLTTPATLEKLIGLRAITNMVVHDHPKITWFRSVKPSQAKKHICGAGGGGKDGVMGAILSRGWKFSTDDEADALALWDFASHLYHREQYGTVNPR